MPQLKAILEALNQEDISQIALVRMNEAKKEQQHVAFLCFGISLLFVCVSMLMLASANPIWGSICLGLGIGTYFIGLAFRKTAKKPQSSEQIEEIKKQITREKVAKAIELVEILKGEYGCHTFKKETHIFGLKKLFNGKHFPTGSICILTPNEFSLIGKFIETTTIRFQKLSAKEKKQAGATPFK